MSEDQTQPQQKTSDETIRALVEETVEEAVEEALADQQQDFAAIQATVRKLVNNIPTEEEKVEEGVYDAEDDTDKLFKLVDATVSAHEKVREENKRLERKVNVAEREGALNSAVTKKDFARSVARKKALESVGKNISAGLSGGGVDAATVKEHAVMFDVKLNGQTVYDAFDDLAEVWDAFFVKPGEDGRNTTPKRLCVNAADITPELEEENAESDLTKLAQGVSQTS